MNASTSYDPPHFVHIDGDGDKLEVIETAHGSVFWAWGTSGDHVAVALHAGDDIQGLIQVLTAIQTNAA